MCLNCHVVSIGIEVNNLDALAKACERIGLTLHRGSEGYRWYGEWVGDSPLPRQLFATEEEFAAMQARSRDEQSATMTAIVNKPEAFIRLPRPAKPYITPAYDIGVYRVGDGYQLLIDEWHGAFTQRDQLMQSYAVERAITEAQQLGHTVFEHCYEDGTIELRIQTGE